MISRGQLPLFTEIETSLLAFMTEYHSQSIGVSTAKLCFKASLGQKRRENIELPSVIKLSEFMLRIKRTIAPDYDKVIDLQSKQE